MENAEMPHTGTSEARAIALTVRRAQAGDRDAFGLLYERYAGTVCTYVHTIVHDRHEAEDVTQHVFAKLMHVIDKYEEREVPFLAWIRSVARNVAVDHIRRQRPIPTEDALMAERLGGHDGAEAGATTLLDALSKLPRDQREVVILRHVAGLSPTEIAVRTARSEGAIHGLHHRGRRALTAELISRGAAPATAGPQRIP